MSDWTPLSKVQIAPASEPRVLRGGVDVTGECWMRSYGVGCYLVIHREEPQPDAVIETEVGKLVWGYPDDVTDGYCLDIVPMPASAFEPPA